MSVRGGRPGDPWDANRREPRRRGVFAKSSVLAWRGRWRVEVLGGPDWFAVEMSDGLPVLLDRDYRTLYGARMAARQARLDYSPGGRLYAPSVYRKTVTACSQECAVALDRRGLRGVPAHWGEACAKCGHVIGSRGGAK